MARMNPCEAEIDEIRLKLYEETRNLTRDEQIRRTNEKTQNLANEYGFSVLQVENEISKTG